MDIYFVYFHLLFVPLTLAIKTMEITTAGSGSFHSVIEEGVTIIGKQSLVFAVKGCRTAVLSVSDKLAIDNSTGHYFLLMIGSSQNRMVSLLDSCFACSRLNSTPATNILDCNEYVDFWTRWDNKGFFEAGKGVTVGEDSLVSIKGTMGDYQANTASITSSGAEAHWKFTSADLNTAFLRPIPGGGTIVKVNERSGIGSEVYDIGLTPPTPGVEFSLGGKSKALFLMDGTKITLVEQLDYEENHYHILSVGTNIGISTSMVVVVEDAIDEKPEVKVKGPIEIPEELPVGSTIASGFQISDPDANDTLKIQHEGALTDSISFKPNGDIVILKRIDREALDASTQSAKITVSDLEGNGVTVDVEIKIVDVNDHAPIFNQSVYNAQVVESPTIDQNILSLNCRDPDEGGSGKVKMEIIEESDLGFFLKDSTLFVKAGSLDLEASTSNTRQVLIQAVDSPDKQAAKTSTAVVIVKLLPRDEHKPSWASPKADGTGALRGVTLASSSPAGTVVTVFRLKDDDVGEKTVFNIMAEKSSEGADKVFHLDQTGVLETRTRLNENSYNIVVSAARGDNVIKGRITVSVQNGGGGGGTTEKSEFEFSKHVYLMPMPTKDFVNRRMRTVKIKHPNPNVTPKLLLESAGIGLYKVEKREGKKDSYSVILSEGFLSLEKPMPTVVMLTATVGDEETTCYLVINTDIPKPGAATPHVAKKPIETTVFPTTTSLKTTHLSSKNTTRTTHSTTATATTTETTPTAISSTACSTASTTNAIDTSVCERQSKTAVIVLWILTVFQWIIIAILLAYHFTGGFKRCMKNSVEPGRRDPLGCEPVDGEGNEKKSLVDAEDTILEIEDETGLKDKQPKDYNDGTLQDGCEDDVELGDDAGESWNENTTCEVDGESIRELINDEDKKDGTGDEDNELKETDGPVDKNDDKQNDESKTDDTLDCLEESEDTVSGEIRSIVSVNRDVKQEDGTADESISQIMKANESISDTLKFDEDSDAILKKVATVDETDAINDTQQSTVGTDDNTIEVQEGDTKGDNIPSSKGPNPVKNSTNNDDDDFWGLFDNDTGAVTTQPSTNIVIDDPTTGKSIGTLEHANTRHPDEGRSGDKSTGKHHVNVDVLPDLDLVGEHRVCTSPVGGTQIDRMRNTSGTGDSKHGGYRHGDTPRDGERRSRHDDVRSRHDHTRSKHDDTRSKHDDTRSKHGEFGSGHGESRSRHGESRSRHDESRSRHDWSRQNDDFSRHGTNESRHGKTPRSKSDRRHKHRRGEGSPYSDSGSEEEVIDEKTGKRMRRKDGEVRYVFVNGGGAQAPLVQDKQEPQTEEKAGKKKGKKKRKGKKKTKKGGSKKSKPKKKKGGR